MLTAAITLVLLVAAPSDGVSYAMTGETYGVPASGAWQVEGHGYGHGRGMGQWSAQAAALGGWSGERIIDWAYPGTNGMFVGSPTVRVRLSATGGSLVFRMPSTGGALWLKGTSNAAGSAVPNSWYRLTASAAGIGISDAVTGAEVPVGGSALAAAVEVTSADGVHIRNADGSWTWYRGMLRIQNTGTSLTVTNHVTLREYLYGVVPRESPSWFHPQALRAQAFAAASYTLAVARPAAAYDICDTTACQVYGGRAKVSAAGAVTSLEQASTSAAVDSTIGWILGYAGKPAFTQFSSSTGGWTRAGDRPYLVAQADPWSGQAPKDTVHVWTESLPVSTVAKSCPPGGALQSLTVTDRDGNGDFGGRVTGVRLDCSNGSRTLTGDSALRFGMKSSWWRIMSGQSTSGPTTPAPQTPVSRAPVGHVDVAAGAPGQLRLAGWAADPDEPTRSIELRVYVDGALVSAAAAGGARPDVAAALPGWGPAHGFDVTVPSAPGPHSTCVWAVDTAGSNSTLLACPSITVPSGAALLGHLDTVTSPAAGVVRVTGWAADLRDPGRQLAIRLSIDGSVVTGSAGVARPDVATVHPQLGPRHGFDQTVSVSAGPHRVCVDATGVDSDQPLGCIDTP